ncbi:hypothetical protein LINGRAHAP2_LOCUS3243 [Linum grandiflorum]
MILPLNPSSMEALTLTTVAVAATTSSAAACSSFTGIQFALPLPQPRFSRSSRRRRRELSFSRKSRFVASAASDGPELDEWDQMELKFGRYLGEDPKLTLAKIKAKKLYPDASYLEVEKEFRRNKGKMEEIVELPFDVSSRTKQKSPSPSSSDGLNLNRPVLKQGMKFKEEVRRPGKMPVMKKPGKAPVMKKPSLPVVGDSRSSSVERSVPDVILRKPTVFGVDDDDDKEDEGLKSGVKMIEPSLMMKMRSERNNVRVTDMSLLRKPETVSVEKEQESPANLDATVNDPTLLRKPETMNIEKKQESPANVDGEVNDMTLLKKPENMIVEEQQESPAIVDGTVNGGDRLVMGGEVKPESSANVDDKVNGGDGSAMGNEVKDGYVAFTLYQKPVSAKDELQDVSDTGSALLDKEDVAERKPAVEMQQESIIQSNEVEDAQQLDSSITDSVSNLSIQKSLQGKPKRLDQPVKERPMSSVDQTVVSESGSSRKGDEFQKLPYTSPMEAADWSRAEEILKSGDRTQVELVSSRTQGFIVSTMSLLAR